MQVFFYYNSQKKRFFSFLHCKSFHFTAIMHIFHQRTLHITHLFFKKTAITGEAKKREYFRRQMPSVCDIYIIIEVILIKTIDFFRFQCYF